jgi:prepilin-type processing-associated H-X9-DG protein
MNGGVVLNEESADVDFRVESNGNANMLFVDGGNNRVGVGTSSPLGNFHVKNGDTGGSVNAVGDELVIEKAGGSGGMSILTDNDQIGYILWGDSDATASGQLFYDHANSRFGLVGGNLGINGTADSGRKLHIEGGDTTVGITLKDTAGSQWGINSDGNSLIFRSDTGGNERMRIDSDGVLLVGKTSSAIATNGAQLENGGTGAFIRSNGPCVIVNRTTNDGEVIRIVQDGTTEGTISTSGSTVSYNAFAGSHWSRLANNSKPTILRGTIMESIATMCDWYQAVADVAESTDSEGNVTPAHQVKESISLPDGKSVGDAVTFTSRGKEYTGVYVKEDNERLPMCKVSDTEDSKAVYGVFMDWDNDDDNVNDMYITSLGAFVVRIHGDETVAIGDYLQSKGDGTAKKQADDILRASTIAKVTSTTKTITHADGSYCVPCTLHCG